MSASDTSKVLIVDDSSEIREALRDILTLDGFDVVEAENGAQALSLLGPVAPVLVLCDITMPEMDGLQFVSQARQRTEGRTVPIVMLTALAERETMRRAMTAGADDYITKPFSPEDVTAAVHAQLAKRQSLVQAAEQGRREAQEGRLPDLPQEVLGPLAALDGLSTVLASATHERLNTREMARLIQSTTALLTGVVRRHLAYFALSAERTGGRWPLESLGAQLSSQGLSYELESRLDTHPHDVVVDVPLCRVRVPAETVHYVLEELSDRLLRDSSGSAPLRLEGTFRDAALKLTLTCQGVSVPAAQGQEIEQALERGHDIERIRSAANVSLPLCALMLQRYGARLSRASDGAGFCLDIPAFSAPS